jgi:hypothetical protein
MSEAKILSSHWLRHILSSRDAPPILTRPAVVFVAAGRKDTTFYF